MRIWPLLLLTAAFAGCVASVPPSRQNLSETEQLQFVVLSKVLAHSISVERHYLCVVNEDPSAALLASLQRSTGISLHFCSEQPSVSTEPRKPLPFVQVRISSITHLTTSTAVVEAGVFCGWLCAAWAEYHCVRDPDGIWRVARIENVRES